MTEEEWLTGTEPREMLEELGDRADDRRLRLFACGVCRRVEFQYGPAGEEAILVAERFADGLADRVDCITADAELNRWGDENGRGHHYMSLPSICLRSHIGDQRGFHLVPFPIASSASYEDRV